MPVAKLEGCAPWDPSGGLNLYGYRPHLAPGVAFSTLFALSMIIHTGQAWYKKRWWCLVFTVGALTELIGWAGRTWSSHCPHNLNAFLMQITTLIMAPTFFTAGLYIILGRLITIFGRHTSPITAVMYLWIFCTCDVLSLVVQAIGGGMASVAVSADPPRKSETGTHIMVAGIVFQMFSISVFVILFGIFLSRVQRDHKEGRSKGLSRKIWALISASAFCTLMIYIRSVYRTVELMQGWSGYLITHEDYFIGLDAVLMLLAVLVFNFVHPGWTLPTAKELEVSGQATPVRGNEEEELERKA
ncbi:RTA1-domain-containing protein [Lindgomyces ingoldianus]|uniref:RTA1-domain-containing protein n=1 Tax=Lindgomyces ingoldianus TaxID=673940 RepID=A0ACB6QKW5_9PLEO|nr:RTA1-domain-containing protein [Lindgomyces ingoldianus]KAF2467638.1 RTA1-domain-containing protein [Lindgomyces ingoldianus]